MDTIITSFQVKKKLNPIFWDVVGADSTQLPKLNPEIRSSLIAIATSFIDSLKLENIEIEDILFLGSLSGYNWSKFSDVDLHILITKSLIKGSPAMVDEFFDAKKKIFNDNHDITVKGFEVEVYVQDVKEKNESNGVYSVVYNKWEKEPDMSDDAPVNKKAIIKKVKDFNREFKSVKSMADTDKKLDKISTLVDKIKKYRQSGLDDEGEMSTENLVFKYLRRSGYMEELYDLKIEVMDKILTLQEGRLFN